MSPLSINSAVTLQIPPGFHLSLYNSPNFLFSFSFLDDITFTFPLQFTHFRFSLSQMISLHCNFQGFVFLCNLPMYPFHFLFLTFSLQLTNFRFFLYLQFFFLGFSFFLSAAFFLLQFNFLKCLPSLWLSLSLFGCNSISSQFLNQLLHCFLYLKAKQSEKRGLPHFLVN